MSRIKDVQSEAGKVASQVSEAAQHQYENLKETASDAYEAGRERVSEWQKEIENYVHEQPLKALLIAAGVGAFVGILWKHR